MSPEDPPAPPSAGKTCPRCGFAWKQPGLSVCPRCVLETQCEDDHFDENALILEDSTAETAEAQVVPGYVIEEMIGRGGSGTVYRATQTALNRSVAIKFLRHDRKVSAERLERMRGESVSLAKLQHPHILAIIDFGEIAGEYYIVMEYAPGGDLRALMRNGPLPPADVARVISETASALSLAHGEGLAHRDVKPENLLLDREGRIRIADFGLAESSSEMTPSSSPLGTPGYMAPELQGKGLDVEADHRADIFSLGCLAYELLTGKLPDDAAALPSASPGVSKLVDGPISKAMSPQPDSRYDSASTFAQDLKEALQPSGHRRRLSIALAASALLVLGLVAFLWSPTPSVTVSSVSSYYPPEQFAAHSTVLIERLASKPLPLEMPDGEEWQAILAKVDRGVSLPREDLLKAAPIDFVKYYLQAVETRASLCWFGEDVDYHFHNTIPKDRLHEILKNDASIWSRRWQILQSEPRLRPLADGKVEVLADYVHLALSARRLRKWNVEGRFVIERNAQEEWTIIADKEDGKQVTPLNEAERHFLIRHFCQNFYDAGCSESNLSQLTFLSDPMYYIDEDQSLAKISKGLEHYHTIRPNRKLSLLSNPEIQPLEKDLYLVACKFSASRGEGDEPVFCTDMMQVRFIDDEPFFVYIKPFRD